MESLQPDTRNHPASATLFALAITRKKLEPPKQFYRCLRVTYFQEYDTPGLEEERTFKSLFLYSLLPSKRAYGQR